MSKKYEATQTEAAILNALSELLKAETMGMVATNAERLRNDMSLAYGEEHFYAVGEDIRSYLENLEVSDDS